MFGKCRLELFMCKIYRRVNTYYARKGEYIHNRTNQVESHGASYNTPNTNSICVSILERKA